MSLSTERYQFVSIKYFLCSLSIFFTLTGAALAQDAVSTASAARTRYLSEIGVFPTSREIAVEEFINYHRHQIGRPKAGEAVALDLRWGNDQVYSAGGEAVLQVGFSTALANDRQELRPVNLSVVIDKSGSMAEVDKISRVKSSLLSLVSQLRDTDVLSIIVFDTDAQALLPAQRLSDRKAVKELILSIAPGGATNIHAGLMLGFEEARKNCRRDSTNRVILLTDGIANRGVTDPDTIARDSLRFNDLGIDLSTIGVGLDLNKDLLRQLAKSGRGLFHFVEDSQDIEKVFVKEVQSLVSPVATEPNVEIEYVSDLELTKLYGYEPRYRRNNVSIKLDDMNQGLTQVILLRFRLAENGSRASKLPVRVRFSYYDLEQRKQIVKTEEAILTVRDSRPGDLLKDPEVGKNYSIALLAQAIRDMAAACEGRNYLEAEKLINDAIARTNRRYPNHEEADIARTLTMAKKYQEELRKYNRQYDAAGDR